MTRSLAPGVTCVYSIDRDACGVAAASLIGLAEKIAMAGAAAASDNWWLATKPRFFSHGSPILCKIPPSRGSIGARDVIRRARFGGLSKHVVSDAGRAQRAASVIGLGRRRRGAGGAANLSHRNSS